MAKEFEDCDDIELINELNERGYNGITKLASFDKWELIKELTDRGFIVLCPTTKLVNLIKQDPLKEMI